MKEHYVTYEQAVKLKELGFDWKCTHYYECGELTSQYEDVSGDGGYADYTISIEDLTHSANKNCPNTDVFDAPRLDQAQAWLREVKGVDIEINAYQHLDGESIKHQYNFGVLTINGETFANTWYNNYEEALSDAIDTALELLTNKPNRYG